MWTHMGQCGPIWTHMGSYGPGPCPQSTRNNFENSYFSHTDHFISSCCQVRNQNPHKSSWGGWPDGGEGAYGKGWDMVLPAFVSTCRSDRATRRYEMICLRNIWIIKMVSHTLCARSGPIKAHMDPLWAHGSEKNCPRDVWAHMGPCGPRWGAQNPR